VMGEGVSPRVHDVGGGAAVSPRFVGAGHGQASFVNSSRLAQSQARSRLDRPAAPVET
jgi:hypothetical protein